MKYPLIILFSIFIFHTTKAQGLNDDKRHFAVSAGFELGLPTQSIYSVGLGGSLKLELPVAGKFSITARGGITSMSYKSALVNNFGTQKSDTFVPLKAGVKYYAGPGFYLEAEAGTAIETEHEKRNLFAYSIGPGFIVPIAQGKSGIDFGFRYESWSQHDLRQTGLRLAYRF